MSMRDRRAAPLAFGRPAAKPRHLGVRTGLIDKDQPFRVEIELIVEPVLSPGLDVRTLLLDRVARLFLCVRPRFDRKYQIVVGWTRMPRLSIERSASSGNVISLISSTKPKMKASCASSFEPGG